MREGWCGELFGSPPWTRFELLRPETSSTRTTPIAFGPMACAPNWHTQTGCPKGIHLEPPFLCVSRSGSATINAVVPLKSRTCGNISHMLRNRRWAWVGFSYGCVLFLFAVGTSGMGHGTYLPFAIYGAPFSIVPILGLFVAPVWWAALG